MSIIVCVRKRFVIRWIVVVCVSMVCVVELVGVGCVWQVYLGVGFYLCCEFSSFWCNVMFCVLVWFLINSWQVGKICVQICVYCVVFLWCQVFCSFEVIVVVFIGIMLVCIICVRVIFCVILEQVLEVLIMVNIWYLLVIVVIDGNVMQILVMVLVMISWW